MLETIRVGGRRKTTAAAMCRFVEPLSATDCAVVQMPEEHHPCQRGAGTDAAKPRSMRMADWIITVAAHAVPPAFHRGSSDLSGSAAGEAGILF